MDEKDLMMEEVAEDAAEEISVSYTNIRHHETKPNGQRRVRL